MTVSSLFYQLLIGPIEILYQYIYGFAANVLNNYGLAIIVLSLAMNFLLLPLYRRADAIQDEERAAEKRMKPVVDHLKKTFHGDERFMMLQTYYRQNNYKPFYVLKGFLSLALEVPFFIAAYNFLSNYTPLFGTSFGPIANLGLPDRMLTIGGVTVNVLPILMTLINLVSGTIYTKGYPIRDKIQLYGIAVIFLVLLYQSPSCLVLYWTLNNLFSLVKNMLSRMEKVRAAMKWIVAAAGVALIAAAAFFLPSGVSAKHRIVFILGGLLLQLPWVWSLLRRKNAGRPEKPVPKPDNKIFLWGCLLMTVLTGLLIPSAVIVSSPGEFVNVTNYYTPLRHLLHAVLLAAGTFLVWINVFYRMSGDKARNRFCLVLWALCLVALVNYMFFGTDLGLISSELHYDVEPEFATGTQLLNLGIVAAVIAAAWLVFSRWRKVIFPVLAVMALALFGMSAYNTVQINTASAEVKRIVSASSEKHASFTLSRNGKNVIFIMLDRAIDSYFPYCLEEKPELKEQFAGFTWYPDTLSFGPHTLFTSAALYGGYEYRPSIMGSNKDVPLVETQNEALRVLPVIFGEAGYKVTVCDPPYANFQWIPDLSIYDDYPYINAFNTYQGQFNPEVQENKDLIWKRNFFCYSLMKCAPVAAQPNIYLHGDYYSSIRQCGEFDMSYAVLKALPSITEISDGDENTFLSLCNNTTHDPIVLSEPEYEPAMEIDNSAYDLEHAVRRAPDMMPIELSTDLQITHYHVNMAAFIQIGKWLDYLREEGVYDNTRIIIASDHGYRLRHTEAWIFNPQLLSGDTSMYNPLLLIKDFGDTELKRDDTFMTNADVPTYLLKDLIENPVNPFTGNVIDNRAKTEETLEVTTSYDWEIEKHDGYTFLPATWYTVKEDVLDADDWTLLGVW